MAAERVQKLLARAGIASRRGAEQLIVAGRVTVNGRTAAIGESADPTTDRIEVDGRSVGRPQPRLHFAVHKPRGFLSSSRDERGRRSVLALLPPAAEGRLWPAGRLDVESEGLMIVTNDGDWANRVLHPRYGLQREYAALVEPDPSAAVLGRLRAGVMLEDGPARMLAVRRAPPPPEIEREVGEAGAWLRMRIGEGRKREVRRLFETVGHRVVRLVRTRLGPLRLAGLRAGEWRPLGAAEVVALAGRRTDR